MTNHPFIEGINSTLIEKNEIDARKANDSCKLVNLWFTETSVAHAIVEKWDKDCIYRARGTAARERLATPFLSTRKRIAEKIEPSRRAET